MGLRLIILGVMQNKGLLAVSVGARQSGTVYYLLSIEDISLTNPTTQQNR